MRTCPLSIPALALLAAMSAGLSLPAHAAEYSVLDTAQSSISFTSKQMGVGVDGRFRKFNAALNFDPAKPGSGSARIDIDLSSIDAGSPDANDEVVGKPWFDIRNFPTASFASTGVKALGGDRYEARGKISIKGKSQEVVLPFTVKPSGDSAVFDGSFVIKRLDFAVGDGIWSDVSTVANEVLIKFRFTATTSRPAVKK
ncbi:MAG: YceI family protein [Zoogloeaceae bacterium]|nr:YceI family protein [Zoogloeaceae bacterium]